MPDKKPLDACILSELLEYDCLTGSLLWLERSRRWFDSDKNWKGWNTRHAGTAAFTARDTHGYHHGSIFGKLYRAHRVAWALHYGEWPSDQIDHINRDRADNRISNLREASPVQNARNSSVRKDNESGASGVRKRGDCNRWEAHIGGAGSKGKDRRYLGLFETFEDALAARRAAEWELAYVQKSEVLYG